MGPFSLESDAAYKTWRERKLLGYPQGVDELIIEVNDPRNLTRNERAELQRRCQKANMAIYASAAGSNPDKNIPRRLGLQLGLSHLDHNPHSGLDSITTIQHVPGIKGDNEESQPYSSRELHWHTDGYSNIPSRCVQGVLIHCIRPAVRGGEHCLFDHELAYIRIRDTAPEYIEALSRVDALRIPAHIIDNKVVRPEVTGPVFFTSVSGKLHMRYTACRHNCQWHPDPVVQSAMEFVERLLLSADPYLFRIRLESGQGIVCNNVLHNRSAYEDGNTQEQRRMVLRARYYDRVSDIDTDIDNRP
jgi:hypothetical protein